jgi:hypothetical protein
VYLALVEFAKARFFASARVTRPVTATTHAQRLERRIARRASYFIHHRSADVTDGRVSAAR